MKDTFWGSLIPLLRCNRCILQPQPTGPNIEFGQAEKFLATWMHTHTQTHTHTHIYITPIVTCPVGLGCRIHRLLLCRVVRLPLMSVLDLTQNNLAPVKLELLGMRSTPLLPSLPGPLWPGVEASDRVLSMSQIELNCVLMLKWIVWNKCFNI